MLPLQAWQLRLLGKEMRLNKHMQRQLQQQLKAEQHPLNQEALEILRVLQALAEDRRRERPRGTDPVLWTPLPILDLMG